MRTMDAVIFQDIGKWGFEKRPVPEVKRPNDVLVEMEACSICGTDVHVLSDPPGFAGTKGIVLGHECVGTVLETAKPSAGSRPATGSYSSRTSTASTVNTAASAGPTSARTRRSWA